MQSWTKKSLVAVAAGGLLVAGVGSALAGENGSEETAGTAVTGSSVQIAEQVPWTLDADATSTAAAAAYREMIAQVRAAAEANAGKYLSVDVTVDGDVSTLSSATNTTVQMVVRADDFTVTGWVDPATDEFFALDSDAPNVLVGPPRVPAPPPQNNQNNNQNNNGNNQNNQNNARNNNNQNPPPPPVQCVDRNGNRINQNNPQCAPGDNGRAPVRRDTGIRVGNPLAATSSAATAQVELSLSDLVGAFANVILGSDSTAVSDLSDAVSTIIQAITGGAGSETIEKSVSGSL